MKIEEKYNYLKEITGIPSLRSMIEYFSSKDKIDHKEEEKLKNICAKFNNNPSKPYNKDENGILLTHLLYAIAVKEGKK